MKKESKKLRNVVRILKHVWKYDRNLVLIQMVKALGEALVALIGVYLSKLIIDELMGQRRFPYLIGVILWSSVIIFLCGRLSRYVESQFWYRIVMLRLRMVFARGEKLMKMDFENTESPQVMDKLSRSDQAVSPRISGAGCAFSKLVEHILGTFPALLLSLGSYLAIMLKVSPLIILFVVLTAALQYWGNKKISGLRIRMNEEMASHYRKRQYYETEIEDVKFSKEIRIYSLYELLMKKYDQVREEGTRIIGEIYKKMADYSICNLAVNILRYGVVNVFLFWQVLEKGMTIGDFSLYLSTIIAFSASMEQLIELYVNLNQHSTMLQDFFDFLDLPEDGQGTAYPPETLQPIRLENVSFSYAGSDKKVLDHMNLEIRPGEKLALVGVNGCGKTTLVKLLVGLYEAKEGRITYGGRDVREYDREAYYDLYSTVFQDVNTFAMTIAENICLCQRDRIDYTKLKEALILAGLWEDVEKLKNTYETQLLKIFDEEGIEFSGGQAQKMAMARALYQDHSVIILDEPTASLDALAEYNVYYQFDQIIRNKTAIYISHRLSSTRFCDRIAYVDGGRVVEYGTHDELMAKNGLYADMFRKQAYYYQEGSEADEV